MSLGTIMEFRDATFFEDIFPMRDMHSTSREDHDVPAEPVSSEEHQDHGVAPEPAISVKNLEQTRDEILEEYDNEAPLRDDTPKTIDEAFASPDADYWKEDIRSEMDSIMANAGKGEEADEDAEGEEADKYEAEGVEGASAQTSRWQDQPRRGKAVADASSRTTAERARGADSGRRRDIKPEMGLSLSQLDSALRGLAIKGDDELSIKDDADIAGGGGGPGRRGGGGTARLPPFPQRQPNLKCQAEQTDLDASNRMVVVDSGLQGDVESGKGLSLSDQLDSHEGSLHQERCPAELCSYTRAGPGGREWTPAGTWGFGVTKQWRPRLQRRRLGPQEDGLAKNTAAAEVGREAAEMGRGAEEVGRADCLRFRTASRT
ncbi:uncharacterized protein LOC112270711 [Brachypodium distachyon]|uniref:uncharacterized protein LOC112270711 n=1 Tax=Brachypodium distachyon TaxID=15368 RepID=UPI000D0D1A90|nr:uncharacterized protein LOC112270711 [Brachypodium distachyon]|eukprot:XP_024314519.1 uncharacterized protein LOC112270711 [Brachypodium distachyon]